MTTTIATAATLTLPIIIGNRYVRRDGEVITANAHDGDIFAWTCDGKSAVWLSTGRVYDVPKIHPHDLVADYIEERCVDDDVDDLRQPVDARNWRVGRTLYGPPGSMEVGVGLHAMGSSLNLSPRAARAMAQQLLAHADQADELQAKINKTN